MLLKPHRRVFSLTVLDLSGDELTRATSVVRHAPRSKVPSHEQGLGEEVLVLSGQL